MTTDQINYTPPSHRKTLDIKKFKKLEENEPIQVREIDFYSICKQAKDYIYHIYDKKIEDKHSGETKEDYVNIFHNAMRGFPSAVNLIKKHLEEFIIENGLRESSYPPYYTSLVDALFEEEFGWGPLSAYRFEVESEGAQVLGTDIKFKRSWGWEHQPFSFRNIEQVMELTQRFSNMDARTTLNEHTSPEMETRTHDNIRVSIMIPERMNGEPVITLRRKVVKDLSFQSLSEFGTIPKEAIPLFESLSRFTLNSVIAGPPGCGKSTMLQAFLNHALYETRNGKRVPERINTVYAETFPEWDVRKLHPKSNVLHVIGRGEEFEKIITSSILRHDISRIVIGEIREHEVGLYKRASLQGIKQVMGTLHDLDPIDIPSILSNLYMQYYPNGSDSKTNYEAFAKNMHLSISMDEFLVVRDGVELLEKKVTGIHIYDLQTSSKDEVCMYTIMEFDLYANKWCYSDVLPARFKRMIKKYNIQAYEKFIDTLSALANNSQLVEI
ncbi:Flp pilus assembly complex ATPase component TadA (plasmid) [Cytobacillus oceanisediminis]|uniref:ATPase, T2SS/T4P/T4SS family n=1 Tax=Cytobacillus oceanisediminis TaxID=665099 RepID=UPI001864FD63|nr:ATPase, T2SS/T4P/T4SS family [Cytobacillus oceanisediminis]QOK30003.1 Flp pilus assembly complex ATPase component TadA [Cytobacillus oceanisediminis]